MNHRNSRPMLSPGGPKQKICGPSGFFFMALCSGIGIDKDPVKPFANLTVAAFVTPFAFLL
jgi:hypothetical protein